MSVTTKAAKILLVDARLAEVRANGIRQLHQDSNRTGSGFCSRRQCQRHCCCKSRQSDSTKALPAEVAQQAEALANGRWLQTGSVVSNPYYGKSMAVLTIRLVGIALAGCSSGDSHEHGSSDQQPAEHQHSH